MARQGIVMKIEKKTMIVMTDEGDFLQLPLPKAVPALGATIQLDLQVTKKYSRPALVAALLVFVLALSLFNPLLTSQSVASVTFDLPLALELEVDGDNRVTAIKAKDAAAQSLTEQMNLKGQDIYRAANQVVQAACNNLTLGGGGEPAFVVSVMPLKDRGKMKLDRQQLRDHLLQELEQQQFEGYLVVQDTGERSTRLPVEALNNPDETVMERHFPGMWCRVGKGHGDAKGVRLEKGGETKEPEAGRQERGPHHMRHGRGRMSNPVTPP